MAQGVGAVRHARVLGWGFAQPDSVMAMQVSTETGALIQAWMDAQRYAPSWARLAANVGVSRQTVRNWAVAMRSLPEARHLRALASEIDQPYPVVLQAALRDAGYLRAEAIEPGSKL